MKYLLIVFALLYCCLEACPPTQPPSGGGATALPGGAGAGQTTPKNTTNKKREADQVKLTVVSNQVFNPSMNGNHLQVFRALVDDYFKTKQMTYNKDLVTETVKNEDGKFAVVYDILGSDCETVKNFVREGKGSTNFVTAMKLKCGDQTEMEIN
ncbi:hypothetical protein OESDEN_10676 [Oesophagostomum dentatum]|uniref:Uncharacterized protein n=1 Tax=Oesophagostomum dentatum TaxID=61180 RepID=A0A0B1T270_OESDE|nr:hypothetical protein OESDEN_10676 [Oesophagostomum dentatum]